MHQLDVIVANYFIGLSVLLALWVFITLPKTKKLEFVTLGLIGGLLALVLATIGSHVFYNPRPFVVGHFTPWFPHGNDNGFPSDHALLGLVYSAPVISLLHEVRHRLECVSCRYRDRPSRSWRTPSHDIIGGFVFSAVGFGIALLVIRYLPLFNKTKPKAVPR